MTGTVQAGLGYLALAGITGVLFVRYAVTGGAPARHRAPQSRPVEVEVPGHVLIPALAGGWPTPAFRHCIGCHATVPVIVHDGAHHCDDGHVTLHPAAGA